MCFEKVQRAANWSLITKTWWTCWLHALGATIRRDPQQVKFQTTPSSMLCIVEINLRRSWIVLLEQLVWNKFYIHPLIAVSSPSVETTNRQVRAYQEWGIPVDKVGPCMQTIMRTKFLIIFSWTHTILIPIPYTVLKIVSRRIQP